LMTSKSADMLGFTGAQTTAGSRYHTNTHNEPHPPALSS
jgi:hypothetical protein